MLFFRVRFVKVSSSHNGQKVTEHWTHFCTIFQTTLLIVIGVQEDIWQGFAIQNCLIWNNSIVRILENQSLFSVFIYNSEKARWISETPVNFHYWIREEQKKTLVEFFEYHKKYPEKSLPQLSAHHRHFICFIPQLELPQVPLFFFDPKIQIAIPCIRFSPCISTDTSLVRLILIFLTLLRSRFSARTILDIAVVSTYFNQRNYKPLNLELKP